MSAIPFWPNRRSLSFGHSVAAFLQQPGLPFASVLSEEHIRRIFAKHHGLFGRTYTTAIVLWAFLSQVLRDGKEAACQSAVSRISSHLQQTLGIGFPIARFVVVISLATACVIDAAIDKYKGKETGETALLRQLLDRFEPGDVAVADRFYGNYWMIALLMMRGVDV